MDIRLNKLIKFQSNITVIYDYNCQYINIIKS